MANPFEPGYAAYPITAFAHGGPLNLYQGSFHGMQNPPRTSKKCALGYHDWDESGHCTRKGCDAYHHANQGNMFGVDPTLAGETQRRIELTGQDELFGASGELKNPGGRCAFCRASPAASFVVHHQDFPDEIRFACSQCAKKIQQSGYVIKPLKGARNPGGATLDDAAEAWARSLGLKTPPRGTPAHRGLMAAWQRSVSRNPGAVSSGVAGTKTKKRAKGRRKTRQWTAAEKRSFALKMAKARKAKARGHGRRR